MCASFRHDRKASRLPGTACSSTVTAKQAMFAGSKVLQALLKAGKIDPIKVQKHLDFLKPGEKEDAPPSLSTKRKLDISHSSNYSSRKDMRHSQVFNAPPTHSSPKVEDGGGGEVVAGKSRVID